MGTEKNLVALGAAPRSTAATAVPAVTLDEHHFVNCELCAAAGEAGLVRAARVDILGDKGVRIEIDGENLVDHPVAASVLVALVVATVATAALAVAVEVKAAAKPEPRIVEVDRVRRACLGSEEVASRGREDDVETQLTRAHPVNAVAAALFPDQATAAPRPGALRGGVAEVDDNLASAAPPGARAASPCGGRPRPRPRPRGPLLRSLPRPLRLGAARPVLSLFERHPADLNKLGLSILVTITLGGGVLTHPRSPTRAHPTKLTRGQATSPRLPLRKLARATHLGAPRGDPVALPPARDAHGGLPIVILAGGRGRGDAQHKHQPHSSHRALPRESALRHAPRRAAR